jgi:hypothetical protein
MGMCHSDCKEAESTCMFGRCGVGGCNSSCMKEARQIEDVVDDVLKKWVDTHLHAILEEKVGKTVADLVSAELIKVIDIDLIPREVKSVEAAVEEEEEKEVVVKPVLIRSETLGEIKDQKV